LSIHQSSLAQTDSFDIFSYKTPEFFTRSILPSRVQCSYKENDTTFCIITIYKSQKSQLDTLKDLTAQWNEYVVKPLSRASKKPGKILTGQLLEGWGSSIAIGNFYQNKKKCVVFLTSFRKDNITACAVYAFSYKLAKGPVETFSNNLHLKK
jgi:hypothetical protein